MDAPPDEKQDERLLTPGTYWDGAKIVDNPAFQQFHVGVPAAPTKEEELLTRGVETATRLHRQGVAINVETLFAEEPSIPERKWRELAESALFRQALEDRGLPATRVDGLTPRQLSALEIYLDTGRNRTHAQKLRAIGITETVWRNWMRQAPFAAYIQLDAEQALQDAIPAALAGIVDAVHNGQKWAIELALEVTGRHDRRTTGPSLQELVTVVFMVLDDAGTPEPTMRAIADKLRTRMGLQTGAAPVAAPVPMLESAELQESAG